MRTYKHTEHYIEKLISNANLTQSDVMSRFEQKGMGQNSYRYAVNCLRHCDIDMIHWILSLGKYAE